MIWEQLNESLILLNVEAHSMEEVMEKVGSKVVEAGFAKPSYVEALVKREHEFATGLDINGFGVAIPHTTVEHVNEPAVAIATLTEPVKFVEMGTEDETVDVRVVFMLAVTDPKAHLAELQAIIGVVQDNEVLDRIYACESAQEVIDAIKQKEGN